MPGPYSPKDQTAPAPQPSAPPAYIPERDSNEVNPEALPPAYSDDVSCSAGMKRSQHRLCLLFTLGLLVLILLRVLAEVGALPEDDADNLRDPVIFFPVLAGLYIIYLIECSCSSTRAFTHNKTTEPDALVNAVHGNPPTIYFSIQCYHYETRHRTRTVRDSNGNTRTEHYTERVRVNTHHATQPYHISNWHDASSQWLPPGHSLTKHRFYFAFGFSSPAAASRYNSEKAIFIATNNRDVHFDFHERRRIAGFKKHVLAVRHDADVPCSARADMFWVFSLIGLSWWFRVHLSSKTGVHNYSFVKMIDS